MLVSIRDDVTGQQAEFDQLDRILLRIKDGAHDWVIDDEDALLDSDWIQSRLHHRDFIQRVVQNASYPGHARFSRRLTVCCEPQATDELRPQQAAIFVSRPLFILMENKFTDGTLLDIAIEFLAHPEIARLHKDACVNLIEYLGAGGLGEVPKHIEDRKQKADELGIPLRLIVFTDSDGKAPGEKHSDATAAETKCDSIGLRCCILSKRTIENYIPDEVFEAWAGLRQNTSSRKKIAILKEMTTEQRDHLAMKDGFGDRIDSRHDVQLYASLTPDQVKEWKDGLKDRVIYRLTEFKSTLSANALRNRDHTGDLDTIISMIMAEL